MVARRFALVELLDGDTAVRPIVAVQVAAGPLWPRLRRVVRVALFGWTP